VRALVIDHSAPGRLRFAEVPEPEPAGGELLVAVEAITLNRGELPRETSAAGSVPGWDAAGVVVAIGGDVEGFAPGDRVVTHAGGGGWAQLRVADAANAALVPDGVSLEDAAALPVAGVTALQAVRAAESVLARRVLVTGASGGVGRFAVQLAARAGGRVVALVGSERRGEGLRDLGAEAVVTSLGAVEPGLAAVIETVGGSTLVGALGLLGPGGVLVSIGAAADEPAVFPPFATVGGRRRLVCFSMSERIGADLAELVGLLAAGELDPQVGRRGDWSETPAVVEELRQRRVAGKAVLRVSGS